MNPVLRTALILLACIILIGSGWTTLASQNRRAAAARAHSAELRTSLAAALADEALAKTSRQQIEVLRQQLAKFDLTHIAPHDSASVWTHAEINNRARYVGAEIVSIIESTDRPPVPKAGPDGPLLTPYRISIELTGTEAIALRFVRAIEAANPLVQFHHLSIINLRPGQPPMIFATIEWPMWNGPDKLAAVKAWRENGN